MKKKLLFILGCVLFISSPFYSQVGINTNNPDSNSMLDVVSTSKGALLPRMTLTERNAMTPGTSNGLTIYNTTTSCYNVWSTADQSWMDLCPAQQGAVDFSSCDDIKVSGLYDMDQIQAKQTVHIDVPVTVTKLGAYTYSAACNGVTFKATGTFVNLGPQIVSLYVDSNGGAPVAAGTFNATVVLTAVNSVGTVTCNSVPVKFLQRSSATLKIINIGGNAGYATGLITGGGGYSATSVYGKVGTWLGGGALTVNSTTAPAALSYAGTASITITNVSATANIAALQAALQDASIVWVGSCNNLANGYVQILAEWFKAGKGVIMITGDKTAESQVADACGYYIEDGSATTGLTYGSRFPQVFYTANGAPYQVGDGLQIGYDGSACGYISSNSGAPFMTVGAGGYPSAFADLNKKIFIFGDKFGLVSSGTTWNNFAYTLADIFAWSLKNAPIY